MVLLFHGITINLLNTAALCKEIYYSVGKPYIYAKAVRVYV